MIMMKMIYSWRKAAKFLVKGGQDARKDLEAHYSHSRGKRVLYPNLPKNVIVPQHQQ
jgi:hypothetical protein